jgi:hypothetical protein
VFPYEIDTARSSARWRAQARVTGARARYLSSVAVTCQTGKHRDTTIVVPLSSLHTDPLRCGIPGSTRIAAASADSELRRGHPILHAPL